MAVIFSDQEIAGLIQEPKPLPSDYQVKIQNNGKSHEHTNLIEGEIFYDFHIHQATQRYQEIGAREDTFAEPSNRFADFQQALKCLFNDCGFQMPYDPQGKLFEEI